MFDNHPEISPELVREHGLTDDEYARVLECLGREPTLTELGVSRVMTMTSTYDHRVIQGAESGQFLDWMHKLLLGEEGFYDEIFRSMRVPYQPVRNSVDRRPPLGSSLRESENLERAAGVMTYIRSYRVRGHVLAKLDPLTFEPKNLPELDMATYGLSIWDKERTFYSDGVTKKPFATLREIQDTLHLTYCRNVGVEFMHIADHEQRHWLRERMETSRNEEELDDRMHAFDVPGHGSLIYAGLQGIASVAETVLRTNDLAHPVCPSPRRALSHPLLFPF